MKKKLVFLAPIVLILLAVMQQQTPNSNAHSTIAISRGEGAITINLPEDMTNAPPIDEIILQAMPLSSSDSTPANCMWNLKDSIFATVDSAGPIYYGKPGTTPIPNYYDVSFSADDLSNVAGYDDDKKPCNNKDTCISDDKKALYYKVFFPLHNYAAKKLPGIIICHAGGFSDCSNYKYLSTMCIEFAKRGFVVYCVEYRRGRVKDINGDYTCVQQNAAIYRAVQDVKGAIRSIIQKQTDSGSYLPYQVDIHHLYAGGQSAGATAVNIAMYCPTQAMINAVFPTPPGQPTVEDVLDTIDADFYYGSPGINIMQKVKGVFNMWGGEGIPKQYAQNQSDFFYSTDPQRNKPMIAFMGYKDEVFWYPQIKQKVYFSPDYHPNFNSDTFCMVDTPYTLEHIDSTVDLIMGSAINFYRILKILGIPVEIHLDCQMGHGLDKDGPGFKSEFGTGLTNREQVTKYMVQRICCYFQLEMNGLLYSLKGTDKFVECENYRVMCDTLANNDSCYQSKTCD